MNYRNINFHMFSNLEIIDTVKSSYFKNIDEFCQTCIHLLISLPGQNTGYFHIAHAGPSLFLQEATIVGLYSTIDEFCL